MRREFSEIRVGDEVEEQSHRPTSVQLFRYSAVTWNSHRIHYDRPYAEKEGYPDVLVQSHLHGAFLTKLCTDWMGETGRLVRLALRVRRFAVPGDVLVCRGTVVDKRVVDDEGRVTLRIEEVRGDGPGGGPVGQGGGNDKAGGPVAQGGGNGEVCAPGEAVVAFPLTDVTVGQ